MKGDLFHDPYSCVLSAFLFAASFVASFDSFGILTLIVQQDSFLINH